MPNSTKPTAAINYQPSTFDRLCEIVAQLRAPGGCPWDREQTNESLLPALIEEAYEVAGAVRTKDDANFREELGDLLLLIVMHAEIAGEAGRFKIDNVISEVSEKLIRRHPHVFGNLTVKNVDQVWVNWEQIKRAEKHGTTHARPSAFDGIPKHLPALLRTEKLLKKARRANLLHDAKPARKLAKRELARGLFDLAREAHSRGWSAEALLRQETQKQEVLFRKTERAKSQ